GFRLQASGREFYDVQWKFGWLPGPKPGAKSLKPFRNLMRKEGVEPSRVSPPDPKSGASASSATFASAGRHYVTTLCFPFRVLGSGFWFLVLGTQNIGTWNQNVEPRTWNPEPGSWYSVKDAVERSSSDRRAGRGICANPIVIH